MEIYIVIVMLAEISCLYHLILCFFGLRRSHLNSLIDLSYSHRYVPFININTSVFQTPYFSSPSFYPHKMPLPPHSHPKPKPSTYHTSPFRTLLHHSNLFQRLTLLILLISYFLYTLYHRLYPAQLESEHWYISNKQIRYLCLVLVGMMIGIFYWIKYVGD
jgi:hypothetical protein